MKQLIRVLTIFVFLGALGTVAALAYKGLVNCSVDSVLAITVPIMDYSFILSTVLHLVFYRKNKIIVGLTIFGGIMIIAAYVIKFTSGIFYPMELLLWDFYLMIYYGVLVIKGQWKNGGK